MFFSYLRSFLLTTAISCGTVVLYYYLTKKKEKKELKTEIIFFTKQLESCRRLCFSNKIPCGPDCSMMKIQFLVNVLESAEQTLDVCVFLITSYEMGNAIIRAQKRGVYVRIIYDENMAFSTQSKISWFVNEGIPVRSNCKDLTKNMHHKYCVIDGRTKNGKLLTGSVNWTMQGFAGNYENCSYTKQLIVVKQYQEMFNKLWGIFETKI